MDETAFQAVPLAFQTVQLAFQIQTGALSRPPTVISDVYRGTVTVGGGAQKVTNLGGSAGGST